MSSADASRGANADPGSIAKARLCLECGARYALGKWPSPYCSERCRTRLNAVRSGRQLVQGQECADHERIKLALVGVRAATGTLHGELWRLVGQPLPIDDPMGLRCESCDESGCVRARLQGRPDQPVPYCMACYRRRLTEQLMAERTDDPGTAQAVLARIFAPEPLHERDDETKADYRKLIYEALRQQVLISSITLTDDADLRAWADAVADRLATAREQGLDAANALESALDEALDDLGLPRRRRKRLVRRIVALVDEYSRSPEMLTDLFSSDLPKPNE